MQRWVLVRGTEVREYLLSSGNPSQEEFNLRAWGDEASVRDDGARVEDEGTWLLCPPQAGLVGDRWRYVEGVFLPPQTE
jgi:hypothetical protein